MFKKAVLMFFVAMLLTTTAGIAFANQVDGMASGTGPVLPSGLTVSVNPGGLGDGLIYGYYNTREALTFFRIINTSVTTAVKARVRFREAKKSAELLDFNVCLSNKDEWSGWIMTNPNGVGAGIYPTDAGLFRGSLVGDTRTAPTVPQMVINTTTGVITGGVKFKCGSGSGCTSSAPALATVTANDTREGYFEIIGEVAKGGGTEDTKVNFTADQCLNNQGLITAGIVDVPNSLGGDATIVLLRSGVSGLFSYNATAIADCNLITDFDIGDESPTWAACANGLAGVNYVLTKEKHIAMYNLEDWSKAQTEVIINFPTKSITAGAKPFNTTVLVGGVACEPIDLNIYNDLQDTSLTLTGFSPFDQNQGNSLCNEVNVIKVENSDIMSSNVAKVLPVSVVTPFTGLGWFRIGLAHDEATTTCTTAGNSSCFGNININRKESFGLPSIGYVLTDLVGTMGAMVETKYITNVIDQTVIVGAPIQ